MSNAGKRSHNAKTRWSNTKRTDTLWAIRQKILTDKKSGETKTVSDEVYVPYDTTWDPELLDKKNLPEPFDALQLDWMEELVHWITDNNFTLSRKQVDGAHQYVITNSDGKHMLTIESERNIMMEHRPKRRRRKRKTME